MKMLPDEAAWKVLEEAVNSENEKVVGSALANRFWHADARSFEQCAARYVKTILTVCAHPSAELRRRAFDALTGLCKGRELELARVASTRILNLSLPMSDRDWRAAVLCLFACVKHAGADGRPLRVLLEAFTCLSAAETPLECNACEHADAPALQRLLNLLDVMREDFLVAGIDFSEMLLQATTERLEKDERLAVCLMTMKLKMVDFSKPQVAAGKLICLASEASCDLNAWADFVPQLLECSKTMRDDLLQVVELLMTTEASAKSSASAECTNQQGIRRVVAAYLLKGFAASGIVWSGELRAFLRRLREDNDPLVRKVAWSTFVKNC